MLSQTNWFANKNVSSMPLTNGGISTLTFKEVNQFCYYTTYASHVSSAAQKA